MIASVINHLLVKFLRVKIVRFRPSFDFARESLIRTSRVDLVIDGGANRGQWATALKKKFPKLPIISIEPVKIAYADLVKNTKSFENWDALNVALGDEIKTSLLNIADNKEQSSSLLTPTMHLQHYPTVKFKETQTTEVVTLDSIPFPQNRRIFLKLDLQGNELAALKGATNMIQMVVGIEVEMALSQEYEGQGTFIDISNFLYENGFGLFSLADAFRVSDGRTTYVDVLFMRNQASIIDES